MDYDLIYKNLIETRKRLKRSKELSYFEEHHILPRCLGGKDDADNLVLLTAREHFIAHRLLCKIYKEVHNLKLAVLFMSTLKRGDQPLKINSRTYDYLRNQVSSARKDKAMPEGVMELNYKLKTTTQISNKLRGLRLTNHKHSPQFKRALIILISNLLYAHKHGFDITFPRNNHTKTKPSVHVFIKAEKLLVTFGYISVHMDSETPLANRKRCRVVANESLLCIFEDLVEGLICVNSGSLN